MTSEQDNPPLPPELEDLLTRGIDSMRAEYVLKLRQLALLNRRMSESIAQHDDACATSMLFVDLRLRRVADRLAAELRGSPQSDEQETTDD